jgi:hypothetical protein
MGTLMLNCKMQENDVKMFGSATHGRKQDVAEK